VRGPDSPRALQTFPNAPSARIIGWVGLGINADEILPLMMLEFVSGSLSRALMALRSRSTNGGLRILLPAGCGVGCVLPHCRTPGDLREQGLC